ncbi:uncharacterized protein LOC129926527 isoform X2 [Biomphalaria glabrata]|uniref:Uncharacterized protein LOC129926527 isoform X2 n=1 Tax=Biomphalaria glabrata TaxID=6526 RepID=A0A9W3AIY1_BIOGL|nr:uncharacterized protein LOC129926527 isoform X2 [Biomphalaria glabrata]
MINKCLQWKKAHVDCMLALNMNSAPSHKESRVALKETLNTVKLVSLYKKYFQNVLNKVCLQRKIIGIIALKKEVDGLSVVLDKLIDSDRFNRSENVLEKTLPSLKALKQLNAKMCLLQKKIKLTQIRSLFTDCDKELMPLYGHILIIYLGLNTDFEHWIESLKTDERHCQDYRYYILQFLEANEQNLEYDPNDIGLAGLSKKLMLLGFTKDRSEAIAKNISTDVIDLQTPLYWAKRYLVNEFIFHSILFELSNFPYSKENTDQWFKQEILRKNGADSISLNINMFNCTNKNQENTRLILEFLTKIKDEDEDSRLYFHGTTYDAVKSILTSGIKLGEGKEKKDFSSGDGFYLSEKLENAEEWASNRCGAVIVYKVQKDFVDAELENGLDVTNDKQKWDSIVKLCRSHYADQKLKRKLLKGITFVRGPISLKPRGSSAAGWGRAEIQLCIREEEYSIRFGSLENICGVIFYA